MMLAAGGNSFYTAHISGIKQTANRRLQLEMRYAG